MRKTIDQSGTKRLRDRCRKGVFLALAAICLVAAMIFVGMSVDLGMITVTKTRMQGAADAAALAATQEIIAALSAASWDAETGLDLDAVNAASAADARAMAVYVAQMNDLYLDPEADVELGRTVLASDGVSWIETWGTGPFNTVRVRIRKDNPDPAAPDARLPLIFAPVFGSHTQIITTTATAFIESRDIVCALDFSASMNDDSSLLNETVGRLGKPAVESSLDAIWNALVDSDVRFSNDAATEKFPSAGFGLINSARGTSNPSDVSATVVEALGLYSPVRHYYDTWTLVPSGTGNYYTTATTDNWRRYVSGTLAGQLQKQTNKVGSYVTVAATTAPGYFPDTLESCIPFPQEGKNSSTGLRLGKPSITTSRSQWIAYVDYVRTNADLHSFGYRKKYGFRTLVQYLLNSRPANNQSEDLWRTPHYPFHALKMGMDTYCNFMTDLDYGDRIGMVDYANAAQIETGLNDDGVSETVNLGGQNLTAEYDMVNTIQMHKQANHYTGNTAIGDGIVKSMDLLNAEGRYGARKQILLMTDGLANVSPAGFSLPGSWDWNALCDYDGDGYANYTTASISSQYALYQAWLAGESGVVINTLCIGVSADVNLMKAIAHVSGGSAIVVTAATSNTATESRLREAFGVLAGQMPPARSVVSED
jgi:hypothetical protein